MPLDPHHLSEARSFELHREIAARVRQDPSLVDGAIDRVYRWHESGALAHGYADEWLALLTGPVSLLLDALIDPSERGRDLRQTSPFTFVIGPRRRWEIWRKVRRELERRP